MVPARSERHANSYLVKPMDFDGFDGMMRGVGSRRGWNRQRGPA